MRILIIRHGDPDYEKDSLTQKGWHEAELLADKMEKTDVTAFLCLSARQSAGHCKRYT